MQHTPTDGQLDGSFCLIPNHFALEPLVIFHPHQDNDVCLLFVKQNRQLVNTIDVGCIILGTLEMEALTSGQDLISNTGTALLCTRVNNYNTEQSLSARSQSQTKISE